MIENLRLKIDERNYRLQVQRKTVCPPDAPRLVIVGHHLSQQAMDMTRVAVRSIHRFTTIPHEVWVVDNNSPEEFSTWLYEEPHINVILNQTEPLPPRKASGLRSLVGGLIRPRQQVMDRSYANGLALQLAAEVIEEDCAYFGIFHNDILICKKGWLAFLLSKFNDQVRGAAVAEHDSPKQITSMSASGYLVDFRLSQELGAHFLPNMPDWDAAELPSHKLVEAGYSYYASRNTFNMPESVDDIPEDNLLRRIHADRSFDDAGDIYFMHLGRGTEKAAGRYDKPGKTYPEQWVAYAEEHLLS